MYIIMILTALSARALVFRTAPSIPHRYPGTRLCASNAAEPHVAALLELVSAADGTFTEAAAASLSALEKIQVDYDGYDMTL